VCYEFTGIVSQELGIEIYECFRAGIQRANIAVSYCTVYNCERRGVRVYKSVYSGEMKHDRACGRTTARTTAR